MGDVEAISIGPGCEVTLNFTVILEDGTIADATEAGEPMTFSIGDGSMVEGLELMLYGMKAGERQCLSIAPQQAFGFSDPDSIHTLSKDEFGDIELKPGIIIGFDTPAGDEVPGAIMEINGDEVVVDFNHPLAGHTLTFDVEILNVKHTDHKD